MTIDEAIKSLNDSLAHGDALMDSETWSGGYFKSQAVRTLLSADAGAQRLVSFEEDSVWPDSWHALQINAAKNTAERVWRSMWLFAIGESR